MIILNAWSLLANVSCRGYNDGDTRDPNSCGNHTKSLALTVRDSLKRLRTDYIDIM